MLPRLIFLFTLIPILELVLLVRTAGWIGFWPTVGLVLVTGVLGAALASREGLSAWRSIKIDLLEGRLPTRSLLDGLSVFLGGALLLTPGLVTDAFGLALLLRPTRRLAQNLALKRMGPIVLAPGVFTASRESWGPSRAGGSGARPGGREIGEP